jgi:2-dehydro-3-deoxyphosphooctonate aldolase (KDO 8-P synthase)
VGIDALFMEVHPDPDNAKSDGPNMVALSNLRGLLEELIALDDLVKNRLGCVEIEEA